MQALYRVALESGSAAPAVLPSQHALGQFDQPGSSRPGLRQRLDGVLTYLDSARAGLGD